MMGSDLKASELLHLLARVMATTLVWILFSDESLALSTKKLVLCACLWRLSQRKTSSTENEKQAQAQTQVPIPKPPPLTKRRVSFGQMEILEFPSLLGDNPSVKSGAPLTMDWKPVRKSIKQVDLVPDKRGPHRSPRALSPSERELLLLSKGYTMLEIQEASLKLLPPSRDNPFLNFKSKVRRIVNRRGSLRLTQ